MWSRLVQSMNMTNKIPYYVEEIWNLIEEVSNELKKEGVNNPD